MWYKMQHYDTLFPYCIAKAYPIPTIKWYKNNTLIPQQLGPLYSIHITATIPTDTNLVEN